MNLRKLLMNDRLRQAEDLGQRWLNTEPEDIRHYQLNALQDQWSAAIRQIPYYQKLVADGQAPQTIESLRQYAQEIPILTKDDIRRAPELFQRAEPPDYTAQTAGSTGEPLKFGLFRHESVNHTAVNQWVGRLANGMTKASRVFLIWGHSHLLGTGLRGRLRGWVRKQKDAIASYRRVDAYYLSPQIARQYYREMQRFNPEVVIGYSCALDQFALANMDIINPVGVRLVIACAEVFPRPDSRATISEFFGAPVVMEYGGVDWGVGAYEITKSNGYKVFWWSHLLETDDNGELLVTALTRRYLPLFRYRCGDIIEGDQSVETSILAFDSVKGRVNENIVLSDGFQLHSVALFHCVHQENVRQLQLSVKGNGDLTLLLVAPDLDTEGQNRIRRRLSDLHPALGKMPIKLVGDIPTNQAGKRRWIIREK